MGEESKGVGRGGGGVALLWWPLRPHAKHSVCSLYGEDSALSLKQKKKISERGRERRRGRAVGGVKGNTARKISQSG